jgi:hypothetical protein
MIRIGKKTRHSPEKIIQRAIAYFGPNGRGLELTAQDEESVRFEGGGGYVLIEIQAKGKHSEFDIETREWDYDVKQFLRKV